MPDPQAYSPQRPNILLIMSDEHAPMFTGYHGHPIVKTPYLDRLAQEGVVFERAYCNTPLCVPSRMSFMTGRYVHHIGAWDNATPLPSDAVTWAHLVRAAGYDAALAGKQHFIGPDKLHGFRAQLARDLHGENHHPIFAWEDGISTAPHLWPSLAQAGPGTTTEIEVDDLAEAAALAYLRDPARREQPWVLNVSFIAPHFPFVVPQKYWDLYPAAEVDLPDIPPGHREQQHPVYRRIRRMFGFGDFPEELVRRGRVGYYGLITYLDDKVGRLLATLAETGQRENTLVIYTSDHGEMAGEHGMWRKSNFYEQSVRIPLTLSWPGRLQAGRIPQTVSLVDLVATVLDIAGAPQIGPLDGDSLWPLLNGQSVGWKDTAFAEYTAHGVARPMAMLRQGQYKLNYSLGDPPELYDLAADPGEFHDLGQDAAHAGVVEGLIRQLLAHWNPFELEKQVRRSQQDRLLIHAVTTGQAMGAERQQWYASGSSAGKP